MGFPWRKIISLRKLVSDLRPIDILTGEIAIEVTGVVEVSPALWYFRYIVSIFLTLHKCLCYNWKFANFWLEIWSRNWRFFIDVCDAVFIVYWCFPFVYFSIEQTASHFNIYCLHFCLISSVSYDEWRIKTVFIINS